QLADKGIAQLGQMAQLTVQDRGNVNALELSPTKVLRNPSTVEPIGLHSLSWRFGDHRWRSDQARIILSHNPIIQAVARWSSLIGEGHFLIGKMFTHVVHKMLRTIRHAQ